MKLLAMILLVFLVVFAIACGDKEKPEDDVSGVVFCCYEQPLDADPGDVDLMNGDQVYRVQNMQRLYYWVRPAPSKNALPGGAVLHRTVQK